MIAERVERATANVIRLRGRPSIEIDGVPVTGPRGRKSWAVLALAVLSDRPLARSRVGRLLFPDADDPLGALRWVLAELRRALGGSASMSGDPLVIRLAEGTVVDVLQVPGPGDFDLSGLPQLSAELLAGMTFSGCDAFESWLLVERRRQAAAAEATIHEAAMMRLGAGRPREAVRFAVWLVELNPLEESHHMLLVRSFAASGDRTAALTAAESCEDLFRRELGAGPSVAVRQAADTAARRRAGDEGCAQLGVRRQPAGDSRVSLIRPPPTTRARAAERAQGQRRVRDY